VFLVVIVARSVELVWFVLHSSRFGGTDFNCWADASNVDVDERIVVVSLVAMLTETGDGLGTAAMTSRKR
jgi:hypothetical protein